MLKQRTPASSTPRVRRWAGAALAAASFALAATSAAAELQSVDVATANFRAGPSTKHPILFSADRFYPVQIIERHDDWIRVRDFENDEAWVAGWLLSDVQTVVVTRDVINVRERPTTKSSIVHTAERGAVFKKVATKGSWVHVADEEGEIGWIHENLLWGYVGAEAESKPEKKAKSAKSKSETKAEPEAKPEAKPADEPKDDAAAGAKDEG